MEKIDYEKMIDGRALTHIKDSIKAAKFEGNKSVVVNYDEIESRFMDTLTPAQYDSFDAEIADGIIDKEIEKNWKKR